MSFVKSISYSAKLDKRFPFTIPAFRSSINLLPSRLTVIIGENGSGKSSLLKTIALNANLEFIGGPVEQKYSFEVARVLAPHIKINVEPHIGYGFFFNPEDYHEYVSSPQRYKDELFREMENERNELGDQIFNTIVESMNIPLKKMKGRYRDNLLTYSHGESTMAILKSRIQSRGLFVLDEPEMGMHVNSIFRLISLIKTVLDNGNSQFIISTHSPILAGIPGAQIYEIYPDGIRSIEYMSTTLYKRTKGFMDNPESYGILDLPME